MSSTLSHSLAPTLSIQDGEADSACSSIEEMEELPENDDWNDVSEATRMLAMVETPDAGRKSARAVRKRPLRVAVIASLLAHCLFVVCVCASHLRQASRPRLLQVHGDSQSEGGVVLTQSSEPNELEPAETIKELPQQIPVAALPTAYRTQTNEVADAIQSPPEIEPVILPTTPDEGSVPVGLQATSKPPLPRFHLPTTMPWQAAQAASARPAASSVSSTLATRHPAAGGVTGARPAGLRGVEHGEDDRLDDRGLPLPEYPPECRRRGEQGLVLLEIEVMPDGSVGNIRALQDAGYPRLADAAIAAVRRARFEPATRDGEPIVARLQIPFRFICQ